MTIFFRLLAADDKAAALAEALDAGNAGQSHPALFTADPRSFAQVPGSPFAYWVGERIRECFVKLPAFEDERRTVKQGLVTADDFRFVRTKWEVPLVHNKHYFLFAKGGEYSVFYADIHLCVNWRRGGSEIRNFVDSNTGRLLSRPQSANFFFQSGLTYSARSQRGLSIRSLPSDCIFSHKGIGIITNFNFLPVLLGLTNSVAFQRMVEAQMAFGSYEVGVIQRTPVPNLDNPDGERLGELALQCVELKRNLDRANEISHVFHLPALLQCPTEMLVERSAAWAQRVAATEQQLVAHQQEIDDIAFRLYGIEGEDRWVIEQSTASHAACEDNAADDDESGDERNDDLPTACSLLPPLISYLVGCPLGRWDIRYATGEKPAPELPDPFDPLPVCPPGMLQNAEGLPAAPADVPADYPLRISWPGILVDDAGHPEDIEQRVREALQVIWPEQYEAIEQEACDILGVKSLRDYFRKSSGFFADHLKRYSKSRRQAPIYWSLATASGEYTLWLYYQRLTDQTLYTCVNDFVDPKLALVSEQVATLRQKSGRSRQDEETLEDLARLERELHDLRAELLRVAQFWQPNLNDGVQITAAPLWQLFPYKPWQKRLKETWEKLEQGDYDWAHLAYSIWPERVRARCRNDKSLAIAHDLEELYVEPERPVKKKGRGRGK